ncbi:MAG: peptide-methionine (S)-S-oxide reductase MsrA [Cyclobacteriaceae bacterium]
MRLISIITTAVIYVSCAQETSSQQLPTEPVAISVEEGMEVATFAGGCFWCTEAIFERVEGVTSSVSGYAGGSEKNPTYEAVSYGKTSHAEAVQVIYDPEVVSYAQLLKIFFATHDPTQLNRQGPDVGEQYRSAVFYHDDEQKQLLSDYVKELEKSGKFSKKIVTQQVPYVNFYEAEKYHQNYYEYNPTQSYVYNVSRPKVEKLLKLFPELVKEQYKK